MHCSRVLICLLKGNMVCIQFKHMYVSENKEFSNSKRMDGAVVFRDKSLSFQKFIIRYLMKALT